MEKNKDFYPEDDINLNDLSGDTVNFFTTYQVNVNKIKTIEDVKLILSHLNLNFTPKSKEQYEEMKHLLIIN